MSKDINNSVCMYVYFNQFQTIQTYNVPSFA